MSADLVRALGILAPTSADARERIAQSLGFQIEKAVPAPTTAEKKSGTGATVKSSVAKPTKEHGGDHHSEGERPFHLTKTKGSKQATAGMWMPTAPALNEGADEDELRRPPFEPLFDPLRSRALLTAFMRTRANLGDIDVDRLIRLAAQLKIPRKLPKKRVRAISRGIQLLIDTSEGMLPFSRDCEWFSGKMQQVAGPDVLRIFRFAGIPRSGVWREGSFLRIPYSPPQAGTLVLVLTDLGIAQPPLSGWTTGGEWAQFARLVAGAGCRFRVLAPYPKERWPDSLHKTISIVEWDRGTGLAAVSGGVW